MEQQRVIDATLEILQKLPPAKVQEVTTFAQFILKQYEEEMTTRGIQKLSQENPSFSFLQEEPDVYTVNDVKRKFSE